MDESIKKTLDKIRADFNTSLEKHVCIDQPIVPLVATFALAELGKILDMIKDKCGIKDAKKMRETFAQRLHAYPLDEKENNGIH